MRIAVGFKVTPDYEALRPADWARAAGGVGGPEVRYVRRLLNVFDEAALELALRLRDARAERGLQTRLAAFSVAGREAEPFLTTLQALGFETAARVEAGAALDFAPSTTGALIAACAQRLGGDVLLLGAQSGPGDSGVVPVLAAEALARPCLTQVTEIEPRDDGRLRVTFAAAGGLLRATVAPPCVLAVGNALVSMLRVPTLKDRLAVRDRSLEVLTPVDLGVDVEAALAGEPAALVGLEPVERSRAGTVVQGAGPREKARALYESELRARLEQP
jgi:electron transfer flavoprotein beta subunit